MQEILAQEYFNFAVKLNQTHLFHSQEWANARAKMGWFTKTVGVYHNNELIACAILHFKKLPKIKSHFCYIPRGMIIDYNNLEHLEIFKNELKAYVKSFSTFAVRIDPAIKRYDISVTNEVLSSQTPIIDHLTAVGFKHQGFKLNYGSTQPRFTFRLDLRDKTVENIEKSYEQRTRYSVNHARKNGIEIIEKTDLDEFMRLMEETSNRGNYIVRSREYFQILIDTYPKEKLTMRFARLNPTLALELVNQRYDELVSKKFEIDHLMSSDQSAKKMKKLVNEEKELQKAVDKCIEEKHQMLELQKLYPDGINLAASFFVTEHDKSWYWFSASATELRQYNPVYLLLDNWIKDAITNKHQFFDFFGVSGTLDPKDKNYGLYLFKKGFGGEYHEFIGEFDLVLNSFVYFIFKHLIVKAQSSSNSKVLSFILKLINRN